MRDAQLYFQTHTSRDYLTSKCAAGETGRGGGSGGVGDQRPKQGAPLGDNVTAIRVCVNVALRDPPRNSCGGRLSGGERQGTFPPKRGSRGLGLGTPPVRI